MTRKLATFAAATFTRHNLLVCGFCALFAAIAGPFGTLDSDGFWFRLIYWLLVVLVAMFFGRFFTLLAKKHIGLHRPNLVDLATMVGMGAVFTPILALMNAWLLGPRMVDRFSPATLLGFVLAVSAAVCIVRRVVTAREIRAKNATGASGKMAAPNALPRLARRLPDDLDGPILRLMVRDHFVEVVTQRETHKIRMRFADAIEEMDMVPGYCTHRSHWVAREAIDSVEREDQRIHLRLKNGDTVPVSRTFRDPLLDAGIL